MFVLGCSRLVVMVSVVVLLVLLGLSSLSMDLVGMLRDRLLMVIFCLNCLWSLWRVRMGGVVVGLVMVFILLWW